jgi:magnesium chelatase subunit I
MVDEDAKSQLVHRGFEIVPGLLKIVHDTGLAAENDPAQSVSACELALEALVARKRISRSDAGEYGRAAPEPRRRGGGPNDLFGGGVG